MTKKIAFSHPTGSTMARQSLRALSDNHLLYKYFTTLGLSHENWIHTIPLPQSIKQELLRRTYSIPPNQLDTHFFPEAFRLLAQKLKIPFITHHETGIFCTDAIFQSHDRHVAQFLKNNKKNLPHAIYGYEDSCLETFRVAHQLNLRCIYELPIAYWETSKKILQEEALRLPEWEPTLLGNNDSSEKTRRKTEEIYLAHTIICPSTFTKNSIPQNILYQKSCHIIPYGSPIHDLSISKNDYQRTDKKLRVLFVGALSQRKGLADLIQALNTLNNPDIELVLLGPHILPLSFYKKQYPSITYYPPCNNQQVLEIMHSCHILALPSLVEGRAIVQLEALACGLPLIITPNTGGDDLIEKNTGFIVPIRSPHLIAEKIHWFFEHPQELKAMHIYCKQKANTVSWDNFRSLLIQSITNI